MLCCSRPQRRTLMLLVLPLWLLALCLQIKCVTSRAILGVDLGSLYMKVALVQSGSPLEIVTNLHSQRKTEQMVLFERQPKQDHQNRFYGADAASLLARKSHLTPAAMSVLLGRDDEHPVVRVLAERHYPLRPAYNETRSGTTLTVDGHEFTPEELVAMVLTHAIDISVAHAEASGKPLVPPPRDVVLTVPSYSTQVERQALLDAASVAGLNVLQLIEETTSAALQYAMEKSFTPEKGGDQIMLFYNMGASAVQVAVVRFYQDEIPQPYGKPKSVPALQVLSKAWDYTMGGETFDHLIVEYLADQFNIHWHSLKSKKNLEKTANVRNDPRAMTKLRLQANKIKHVLSANLEIPVHMDALHDDTSLTLTMTRTKLEELAQPLLDRAVAPIHLALKQARRVLKSMNYTRPSIIVTNDTDAAAVAAAEAAAAAFDWDKDEFLTGVELLGGGMRIPAIQLAIGKALPDGMELGLHMNGDESMALGAAFCGANISTAFRVRPVGMTDCHAFAQQITLQNLADKSGGGASKKNGGGEEPWSKQAVIFKAWGKMGVKKTIAFSHDEDVHCALDYVVPEPGSDGDDADVYVLPEGTDPALERFNLTGIAEFAKDMAEKGLLNMTEDGKQAKPKVTLQFELSPSGITSLVKAEVTVTETYMGEDEVVVEVDEDEEEDKNATNTTNTTDTNATSTDTNATADDTNTTADASNTTEGEDDKDAKAKDKKKKDEKPKKKKKKKQTIKVPKEKKRVHRKALGVGTYHVSRVRPATAELLEASRAKLLEMAEKDKERMLLEEAKNKVESYFYMVKNKLVDDEDAIAAVSTEEQREECRKLAEDTEDWLYYEGGPSADLATMKDKYTELSVPFEKILLRINENKERPKIVEKIEKQFGDIEKLMTQWVTTMPQVTEEERTGVLELVEEIRKKVADKLEKQAAKKPHEEPAFLSAELAQELMPLEIMVLKLSKKPKPKPPPKKKKSENTTSAEPKPKPPPKKKKSENTTSAENATDTNATDTNTTEGDSETDDAAANSTEKAGAGAESQKEKTKEDATAADVGDDEL